MFALQVVGLEERSHGALFNASRGKDLFLELSSEGQVKRTYQAGRLSTSLFRSEYQNLIHYCSAPVTLRLSYGATREQLGHSHVFWSVSDSAVHEKEVPFYLEEDNGEKSHFVARVLWWRLRMEYKFELNEVICLNQASFFLRKDHLFAEVEFNACAHSLHSGPTNTYDLGRFQSQDACFIHIHNSSTYKASHNSKIINYENLVVFTCVSGFKFSLFTKNTFSRHFLGQFHFVPTLPDGNVERVPLEFRQHVNEAEESRVLFGPGDSLEHREKVILATSADESSTGLYEITFTVRCEPLENADPQKQQWEMIQQVHNTNVLDKFLRDGPTLPLRALNNKTFGATSYENEVEFLIDGKETYQRQYEALGVAQHSINILAWELSLSFGLVERAELPAHHVPPRSDSPSEWVTLADILLERARQGVKIRIIMWRHSMMTMLNRLRYLGPVEQQISEFCQRAKSLGLSSRVFRTTRRMPGRNSVYAEPALWNQAEDIVIVIAGNPRGLISCHHEKLLLIDPECPAHTIAFTGGFDIAGGRYDTPSHDRVSHMGLLERSGLEAPSSDSHQSVLPWHDSHLLLKGPVTQHLYFHFLQRWMFSFSRDSEQTRSISFPLPQNNSCSRVHCPPLPLSKETPETFTGCKIRMIRNWNGSFDVKLFRKFCQYLVSAKKLLYLEHQYPFQNGAITYSVCECLRQNPDLRVIIVTPVKTDLPSGLLGDFFNWSQDHIIDHLQLIQSVAPDRVGIFGLVVEEEESRHLRSVYVHSKLALIDDAVMVNGSTNMDSISFYYCSEMSAAIHSPELAKRARIRLGQEHLGRAWRPSMEDDIGQMFDAFCAEATLNMTLLRDGYSPSGRLVWMAPATEYEFLVQKVGYPHKLSKLMRKMGVNPKELSRKLTSIPEVLRSKL